MTSVCTNMNGSQKHYFEHKQSYTRVGTIWFKSKLDAYEMWRLAGREHEKNFRGDRNVLYIDWGCDNKDVCICENSLKYSRPVQLSVCKFYLN